MKNFSSRRGWAHGRDVGSTLGGTHNSRPVSGVLLKYQGGNSTLILVAPTCSSKSHACKISKECGRRGIRISVVDQQTSPLSARKRKSTTRESLGSSPAHTPSQSHRTQRLSLERSAFVYT